MLPNSQLLSYGAPLTSAFRSLGPSIHAKHFTPPQPPARPDEPQLPDLYDLTKKLYGQKELAALAQYFTSGLGNLGRV